MKVRFGFISNSSSTSFTIYGIYIESDPYEKISNIAGKMGLFTHGDQDGEGVYIGRKWSNIRDNETGAEFKKYVKEKIALLALKVPINTTLITFEKGWYDG